MTRLKVLNAEPREFSAEARAALAQFCDAEEVEVSRGEMIALAPRYDAMIVRLGHRIDRDVLSAGAAGRLRAISSATTGLDHIDLQAAADLGIEVLSLKGETAFLDQVTATAELTWALLLALIRHLPEACADVRAGNWRRDAFHGIELSGRTLGIVGYGRLGRMVARYGSAFGMRVLVTDPNLPAALPDGVVAVAFESLLGACDVLSLHVPLAPGTRHLIGNSEFAQMREGAILLNTARGEIVDGKALLAALVSGRLAGAGVDVVADEKPGVATMVDHPLVRYARERANLIVTPHIGGATTDSMRKTEVFMAQKLRDWAGARGRRSVRPGGAS